MASKRPIRKAKDIADVFNAMKTGIIKNYKKTHSATGKGQTTRGAQLLKVNKEFAKEYEKYLSLNQRKLGHTQSGLDQLWENYKTTYATAFPGKKVAEHRKHEFFSFVIANQVEAFDPTDNLAAFQGGDIVAHFDPNTKSRQAGSLQIQLKSSGASFKIHYSINVSSIQTLFTKYGNPARLPRKELELVASAIFEEQQSKQHFASLVEMQQSMSNKKIKNLDNSGRVPFNEILKFMRIYIEKFSKADYYVFYFEDYLGFSISVKKDYLLDFIQATQEFWTMGRESTSKNGSPLVFFRKNKKGISPTFFWMLGLQQGRFMIHHYDHLKFYNTRGVVKNNIAVSYKKTQDPMYNASQIKEYNADFNANKDFLIIHETLFGSLSYLKNR